MNAIPTGAFQEMMDYIKDVVSEEAWNQINTYGMTIVFSNAVDIYGVKVLRLPSFMGCDSPIQIDVVEEYVKNHGFDCVLWNVNIDGVLHYAIKCFTDKCNFEGCKSNGYCFQCSEKTIVTSHISEAEIESAILDSIKKG